MLDRDQIDNLDPVRDKPAIYAWLRAFLRWHLDVWSKSAGLRWREADIDAHIEENDLVAREWLELTRAAEDERQLVAVARANRRPIGILHAQERTDRYLLLPIGVVCWLFIEPVSRGVGVSRTLMDACHAWMKQRGLGSAEVFVTAENRAAVRVYQRSGYEIVDHRLIARLDDAGSGEV